MPDDALFRRVLRALEGLREASPHVYRDEPLGTPGSLQRQVQHRRIRAEDEADDVIAEAHAQLSQIARPAPDHERT